METSIISVRQVESGPPDIASHAAASTTKFTGVVDVKADTVPAAGSNPSAGQIKDAVSNLNKVVQSLPHGSSLEFMVDQDTKINVVKVVDKTTNEVIRQIPSEEIIDIARALDKLQGLVIRQKA